MMFHLRYIGRKEVNKTTKNNFHQLSITYDTQLTDGLQCNIK